jgi:hypothetical protein
LTQRYGSPRQQITDMTARGYTAAMVSRERIAHHEAGHCCAALIYNIEILNASIDALGPPHVQQGSFRLPPHLHRESAGVFYLSGGAAEQLFFGTIPEGHDGADIANCREYLLMNGVDVFTVGAEMARLRSAADRLVASERDRIRLIAEALLRHGRLTGEQILELSR